MNLITLIDNSTGSYYPFLNLSLTQFNIQMINRNNLTINFSLELNSFNYIALYLGTFNRKNKIKFEYWKKDFFLKIMIY